MDAKYQRCRIQIRALIVATLAALAMLVLLLSLVQPSHADLPPRPENTPTPKPASGGAILLHAAPSQVGLWAVVQWQDGLGDWHDVDGWRGAVQGDRVPWWVSNSHFDVKSGWHYGGTITSSCSSMKSSRCSQLSNRR